MMERNEDGTRAEKEQRFKEGVGEQMEHGGLPRGETDGHDHIAELRKRGIGQNTLDVVLLRGDERGHYCGNGANPRDYAEGIWRSLH